MKQGSKSKRLKIYRPTMVIPLFGDRYKGIDLFVRQGVVSCFRRKFKLLAYDMHRR